MPEEQKPNYFAIYNLENSAWIEGEGKFANQFSVETVSFYAENDQEGLRIATKDLVAKLTQEKGTAMWSASPTLVKLMYMRDARDIPLASQNPH